MEQHEVIENGKTFVFEVLENLVEPCPQCGIPACGREDFLWYEEEGVRTAILFDGGLFNLVIESFLEQYLKSMSYADLPIFIQEWNEARGWTDCWDYQGYELVTVDFLRALDLLQLDVVYQWFTKEELGYLAKIALTAQEKGLPLKIVRG